LQNDGEHARSRSWGPMTLALAVSASAHGVFVKMVPGVGAGSKPPTLEVTIAPPYSPPSPHSADASRRRGGARHGTGKNAAADDATSFRSRHKLRGGGSLARSAVGRATAANA
jgi:hypothetical protein